MRETQVWSLGREDLLEKEMAAHSSTLAWKSLWMEEPGGLQSMGFQRVGHYWVTSLHFRYLDTRKKQYILGSLLFVVSDFPCSSVRKESACNAEDLGSISRLGRSSVEENGNRLQYSCLENPMDRGVWRATVHGVTRVGHDLATKPPPEGLRTYDP